MTGLRFTPVLLLLFAGINSRALDWEQGFQNPPAETKPAVYWYWISDNISSEGITRDLEAMARAGIGEAFIGNVDVAENSRGTVKALTPEWWNLVVHAIREGKRVGVKVGLFNCPGWSQSGGPWVKPEQSMRYVTISETRLKGPRSFVGKLPAAAEHFQDIAVVAFPAPRSDSAGIWRQAPVVTASPESRDAERMFDGRMETEYALPGGAWQVEIAVAKPFTARSLTLYPSHRPFRTEVELEAEAAPGDFRTLKKFGFDRSNPSNTVGPMPYGPVTVAFPAVTARRFRLRFTAASKRGGGFAEIELSGAARLERFVEKQLGKMWQTPSPLWDAYLWPPQAEDREKELAIKRDAVQKLTSKLKADGTLEWQVPAGEWIVLRTGMAPTGVTNAPASPEATGLEIDKMSRPLVRYHFDQYVGKLLARLTPEERRSMGHVIADSYETGAQNWTDGMAADFEKRYGYDPLPWLPVLTGRIVDSADASNRFLWDLRRMVADRISYEYVGGLREAAAGHGLRLWLENYGHWGYPGEFLQYGGQSPDIGGEFWAGQGLGSIELRAAASAGHIYGKPVISAEAFTGGPAWQSTPWTMRPRGDWATAQGINHFVLHVAIHQPYEDRLPGMSAWFGTEFNRLNTWFGQAGDWIRYLRRTHFLLQQGRNVADVAYFIGEDAPKMTGPVSPAVPEGYSFDYINAEVIEKRLTVKNDGFVLPDGTRYRLLLLPDLETMRPQLLARLRELVREGGAIAGPAPLRSPSLENYPACDREVKRLASEIWSGDRRVFPSNDVGAVLRQLGVEEDLRGVNREQFPWTHRSAAEGEIYFISHQGDDSVTTNFSFRVSGRQPEVWDAVTGERRVLPRFRERDGRTEVALEFAPRQSWLVVFRHPGKPAAGSGENFPRFTRLKELDGSWLVRFDPKWGAPAETVFPSLVDWTSRPEPGIRYYSGTAIYRQSFDAPPGGGRMYLSLGTVHSMARVRLNGTDLGLVWCAPWRVEITRAVQARDNRLEIEVVNTWNNRMVGDFRLPANERRTWTPVPRIKATTKLLPAGLIGPVTLERRQ